MALVTAWVKVGVGLWIGGRRCGLRGSEGVSESVEEGGEE